MQDDKALFRLESCCTTCCACPFCFHVCHCFLPPVWLHVTCGGCGVQLNTQRAVRHALAERVPVVLVINKVDRLITELKLPPADAYHKLRHTLEEVNALLRTYGTADDTPELDPAAGNVVFAAANAGWSFTLQVRRGAGEAKLATEDDTPFPRGSEIPYCQELHTTKVGLKLFRFV